MTIKECIQKIKDASTGGYSMVMGEASEIRNTFEEVDTQLFTQGKRIEALEKMVEKIVEDHYEPVAPKKRGRPKKEE